MRNPITNFIKHWKKHGFKKTIEQLRFNYIMLEAPMSLINKQLMFYHFVLSGLCLGSFSLF